MTLCEVSFHADVPYTTLCWRIRNGWTLEEAVSGKYVPPSIREYMEASDPEYMTQMRYTTAEVFKQYLRWCDKNRVTPIEDIKTFSKQMRNWGWTIKSNYKNI